MTWSARAVQIPDKCKRRDDAHLYRWRRLPVLETLPKLLMLSMLLMLDRLP